MANEYIICAFYTRGTLYEGEVAKLEASAKKFNLPFHKEGIEDLGSWDLNTHYTPIFIKHMMAKFPDKDIVYLDADATIEQYPTLFDEFEGDIGVHYRGGLELLNGTMYLCNNDKVAKIIDRYIENCEAEPKKWDQKCLQSAIKELMEKLGLVLVDIPAVYCKIFDIMKDAGPGVIVHWQASRRAKASIHIPEFGPGLIRVRSHADGSFWIARKHKATERHLDSKYQRLPNQLRWFPRLKDTELLELKDCHKGQLAYIVGKGPSLDVLRHADFGAGIVIALNEAIHKIEDLGLLHTTYMVQQDIKLAETCQPRTAIILASRRCRAFYNDYPKRFLYNAANFGLTHNTLSVLMAIEMAKYMGVNKIVLMCFDACVNQNIDYAKCIGYEPTRGGDPIRFRTHKRKIVKQMGEFPYQWFIPGESLSTSEIRGTPDSEVVQQDAFGIGGTASATVQHPDEPSLQSEEDQTNSEDPLIEPPSQ